MIRIRLMISWNTKQAYTQILKEGAVYFQVVVELISSTAQPSKHYAHTLLIPTPKLLPFTQLLHSHHLSCTFKNTLQGVPKRSNQLLTFQFSPLVSHQKICFLQTPFCSFLTFIHFAVTSMKQKVDFESKKWALSASCMMQR